MWQIDFNLRCAGREWRRRWLMIPLCASGALAGCSADVIRLDGPSNFSLSDNSAPRPMAPMARSGAGASSLEPARPPLIPDTYVAPRPAGGEGVKMAALPEPVPATPYAPSPAAQAAPKPIKAAATPAAAAAAAPEKGEGIEVKQGDTLFGLSKRHHASVAELMAVNGLTSPNLKPGQTLYLPLGKPAGKKPLTRAGDAVAAAAPASAIAHPIAPLTADQIAKYDGAYTVKKGDSLYALALQLKVPYAELQTVNGITDVRKVRPGAVLKVPAASVAQLPAASTPSVAAASIAPAIKVPAAVVATETAKTIASSTQPVLLNGKSVATADATKSDAPDVTAAPAAPLEKGTQVAAAGDATAASMGKLRWPAKGRMIGSFGPRPDGTHNDGVNLSVPLGTEVHAAESGVVAYAGSELKGYGNLILVRHDNGWITAYAHNEELLAKRGDKVKRGQVLAKAGKSGQVDQPQVHFELRQGSKPVDPTPFMEKL